MGYYAGNHAGLQSPSKVDYSTMTHTMAGAAIPQNDESSQRIFIRVHQILPGHSKLLTLPMLPVLRSVMPTRF